MGMSWESRNDICIASSGAHLLWPPVASRFYAHRLATKARFFASRFILNRF